MSSDQKTLRDKIESVESKEDWIDFIAELKRDLEVNKGEWENSDLASFLEAMGAWVADIDGYYKNQGRQVPENVPWKMFANILYAAKYYE